MIKISFPMDVSGKLEKDICRWTKEYAILGNPADHILFKDWETVIVFKLKFGISIKLVDNRL